MLVPQENKVLEINNKLEMTMCTHGLLTSSNTQFQDVISKLHLHYDITMAGNEHSWAE